MEPKPQILLTWNEETQGVSWELKNVKNPGFAAMMLDSAAKTMQAQANLGTAIAAQKLAAQQQAMEQALAPVASRIINGGR